MRKSTVKVGQIYGRLRVIQEMEERTPDGHKQYLCQCSCGNETVVKSTNLTTGKTKSCGCYRVDAAAEINKSHGCTQTRLYRIWGAMKRRCTNPHAKDFEYYGGRGIRVCPEWANSFETFMDWSLLHRYDEYDTSLTIDRIDPDGNYEPSNCRWTNMVEQSRNKTNTIYIKLGQAIMPLAEAADKYNINYKTMLYRYNHNWNAADMLKPVLH